MRLGDLVSVQRRLSNGLTLCVVPMPQVHRAVLHGQLSIGSRFEGADDNGLSHFLEHMLYRGTERHPSAHELAVAFERRGAHLDAATACDVGTLTLSSPTEELDGLVSIFAEVFASPCFSELEIERGIIREEILESLDDSGRSIDADELLRALVFESHPLGLPIAGTIRGLDRFDVPKLRAHHQRFYTASNTVLVVVGAVEPEPTLERLAAEFSRLPSGPVPDVTPPAPQTGGRFLFVNHDGSQTSLRLGLRAPGLSDSDQTAMEVLVRLLDDGMATRLYHRICDQRGLCYEVSAGYDVYTDSGLLELAAETAHERAPVVLGELLGVLRELRDTGPEPEELLAMARRFRWQAEAMLDEPEAVAGFFADSLLHGRPTSLLERCARIDAVTIDEVQRAARRWWIPEHLNVLALGVADKRERAKLRDLVADFGSA